MALRSKAGLISKLYSQCVRCGAFSENFRSFNSSSKLAATFWEPHIKGPEQYRPKDNRSTWENIKGGFKLLGPEFKLWIEEIREKFRDDVPVILPGDYDIIWSFNDEKDVKKWIHTADGDHNEGFSSCNFYLNENQKGTFSGYLNPKPPKDGRIKRAGYCNIKIPRVTKSFKRQTYLDWTMYTHLLVRLRGDGRTYVMNIHTEGTFDILWHDIYSYALYTRGGPYWQTAKIPFSRFALTSKGRIQDKQGPLPKDMISSVGITLGDNIPGPFNLEIDYIGVYFDPSFTDEFAYEMYKMPNYTLGA